MYKKPHELEHYIHNTHEWTPKSSGWTKTSIWKEQRVRFYLQRDCKKHQVKKKIFTELLIWYRISTSELLIFKGLCLQRHEIALVNALSKGSQCGPWVISQRDLKVSNYEHRLSSYFHTARKEALKSIQSWTDVANLSSRLWAGSLDSWALL